MSKNTFFSKNRKSGNPLGSAAMGGAPFMTNGTSGSETRGCPNHPGLHALIRSPGLHCTTPLPTFDTTLGEARTAASVHDYLAGNKL